MEYVKICGLKNSRDIEICIEQGADAIGFIYNVPDSPRNLEKQKLKNIVSRIKNNILTVIVSKYSDISELKNIMKEFHVDLFQIHIKFDLKELDNINSALRNKIIVALKINQSNKKQIIELINNYQEQFFAFLIDNSEGHGTNFDFDLIKEILEKTNEARIILAGGIDIDNAEKIIKDLNPYGIDVSSSLEIEKGVKDPKKIKEFLIKIKELKNFKRD